MVYSPSAPLHSYSIDTMNTASRMESTGVPGRIQLSQETADLLAAAGKSHWIKPREETVYAKGKGEMSTFFLHVTSQSHGSSSIDSSSSPDDEPNRIQDLSDDRAGTSSSVQRLISEKTSRLIDWNVELLMRHLKMIAARRQSIRATKIGGYAKMMSCSLTPRPGIQPIEEVVEVIELPEFDAEASNMKFDADSAQISTAVFEQLRSYVTSIAALYVQNVRDPSSFVPPPYHTRLLSTEQVS
jgi:Adenylate and Guanylate cyclase catalytic domain